jgi:TolA-binding protein
MKNLSGNSELNKQLKDYKDLDKWFDNNAIEREFILSDQFVFKDKDVYKKLLELAQQLEQANERVKELEHGLNKLASSTATSPVAKEYINKVLNKESN